MLISDDVMKYLEDYLEENKVDDELKSVVMSLAAAIHHISGAVTTCDTGKAGSQNVFGE